MDRTRFPAPQQSSFSQPDRIIPHATLINRAPEAPQQNVGVREVLAILVRWSWLIALIMVSSVGTAYIVSHRTPQRWRATERLILIQRAATTSSSAQASYVAPMEESIDTQVAMLQSYDMGYRTAAWLKNDAIKNHLPTDIPGFSSDISQEAEELQKATTAVTPKETNLIDVSVEAGSRDLSQRLTNAVCQAFVEWKNEVSKQNIQDALTTLEERADKAKAQMLEAERQEMTFKQTHQLVDVDAQQKDDLDRYLKSQDDVTSLGQELKSDQTRMALLGQQLHAADQALKQGTGVRDDTTVIGLQTQLNQLEIQRADAALKYRAAFPGMLSQMDAQIRDLKRRLADDLRGTVDNKKPSIQAQAELASNYSQAQTATEVTQAKLTAATLLRDQLKNITASQPATSLQYAQLSRTSELARSLYTSLQASLNEARVDKDLADGNVQAAGDAFAPEKPFQPNHLRDLAVGAGAGLGLAFLVVMLLEQADRRVRTVSAVRRLAPDPVVGSLPRLARTQAKRLIGGLETPPEVMDAYSLARANLSLAMRSAVGDDPWGGQVVMVTSAAPGEGKSITAAEIARSFARSGANTILVDADMRRPAQNLLFDTAEPIGLADVLEGRVSIDEALVGSGLENLSILHSGSPTRNPTDLCSGPKMKALLEDLCGEASVVVVDTPACSAVADALLLAPIADCILHVVGAGRVDEELVRETIGALGSAGPKMLALFVNRVARDRSHNYRCYYSVSGARVNLNPPGAGAATIDAARVVSPATVEAGAGDGATDDDA